MSKQVVSVSLGSQRRNKETEITLFDETVCLRREGWEADVAQVTARFTELDGQVDVLGVGGMDLWVYTDERRYPLYGSHKLIAGVKQTPVVDGSGLKNTLERQVVTALIAELGEKVRHGRVLIPAAVDRFGMTAAFAEQGYELICGELAFALGIPVPIRTLAGLRRAMRLLMPVIGRLPVSWLYPMGEKQNEIVPKYEAWYQWADVIAGDCLFIKRHMPDDLEGKIIVTNTTTEEDRRLFAERGVTHVMTTTPVLDGRSFGTNLLEAALTAVAGKQRPLKEDELKELITALGLKPTLLSLG